MSLDSKDKNDLNKILLSSPAVFISVTAYSRRSLPRMKEVEITTWNSQDPLTLQIESTNSVLQKIPWLSFSLLKMLSLLFSSVLKLLWFLANPHQDQHFVKKIYFQPDFKMWIRLAFFFFITTAIRYCTAEVLVSWISHKLSFLLSKAYKLFWEALRKHITYNWLNFSQKLWFLVYYYSHFAEEKLSPKLFCE